jgi:hypothetical protein
MSADSNDPLKVPGIYRRQLIDKQVEGSLHQLVSFIFDRVLFA